MTSPAAPRVRPRRRWLTALVVVVLISVPAVYLVVSAQQSRESGKDKQATAAATGLVWEWPSKATRRIYEVDIPPHSTYVAHYEENSWERSSLYVQFRTSPEGLDAFLAGLGRTRDALEPGTDPVTPGQAGTVGWDLERSGRHYAGTTVELPGARPQLALTVDLTKPERPHVHAVSTASF
ncbi:hypothetical protein V1J52_01660 [Streptomyces sp. TRM 70351]|uniref:hypothetical protein n=1 Tax=Streptomyces sp. TRM 70351 TaxID=3116552 RepID=UPI002E7C2CBD|nr:hypothetical protein [Streptomyces sp. TRM 70351]MEE1926901.1 hypothetical protein [Streptomyces sp. TRM 70351]